MPVEFLTDVQAAAYGRFAGPPTRAQLERFFFLHDDDRVRVAQRRQPHTQLGFAVQLGTVRFLGTFLADPLDVPHDVVAYVAGQLGVDPACFRAYAERARTPYEHAWEIRRTYGYRDYAAAEGELQAFLAARAWASNEGPRALFDRATAWLIEHKVLLPGATTLARAVVAIRAAAAEQIWRALAGGVDAALRSRLERLLDAAAGARRSTLERLRTSPSRVSGSELVRALERGVARAKVNLAPIRAHWPDMLRVAGSLATGTVRAYDLLRMLSHDGRPSRLGQAFAAYGHLPKTLHLLAYIDVNDTYRRQLGAQLTIQESRHQLGQRIFHGQRGELRQRYREGQEDQLSALGLVLNAVVLWNTFYMDRALSQLRADGYPVYEEDGARLAPLGFHHINFLGRYVFTPPGAGVGAPPS